MIKSTEVRIGNLVSFIGKPFKIAGIDQYSKNFFLEDDPGGFIREPVIGIPLTPEWLERCGFHKLNAGWINQSGSMCFYDTSQDINGDYMMDYGTRNYNARFKYLHQLQNLYHALTGEELSITL